MATQFLSPNEVVGYIRAPKAGALIVQLEFHGASESNEQWDVEQADGEKNDNTADIVAAQNLTAGDVTLNSGYEQNLAQPAYLTAELTGAVGSGSITIKGTVIDDLKAEIPYSEQVITYTSSNLTQRLQTSQKMKDISSVTLSSGFTGGTFNLKAYGKVWGAVHTTNRAASSYTGLTPTNLMVSFFTSDLYDYRIIKAQGTDTNNNTSFATATWDKGTTKLYRG